MYVHEQRRTSVNYGLKVQGTALRFFCMKHNTESSIEVGPRLLSVCLMFPIVDRQLGAIAQFELVKNDRECIPYSTDT